MVLVGCGAGCATTQGAIAHSPLEGTQPGHLSAEEWYARGQQLEASCQAACVDAYLMAALVAWPAIECAAPGDDAACALYHDSVARLVTTAQQFGRFDGRRGLIVSPASGTPPVETVCRGFLWTPSEFGTLAVADEVEVANIDRPIQRPGIGVPVVVSRRGSNFARPFVAESQTFAATVLVRSCPGAHGPVARFELIDPRAEPCVGPAGRNMTLAADLTAPLGREDDLERLLWLQNFIRPAGAGRGDNLFMLEPYQPGKIPLVLVHGILSDAATWASLINDMQCHPELLARYQVWCYQYDTGEPFFASAADLRRQLRQIRACYDPRHQDRALDEMVLVGHSMGGLVSKLQVTYSGETLWSAAASVPLESLCTDGATRAALAEAFFFDPQPAIARVIFIGTPHRGSGIASRSIGRVGSMLVEPSPLAAARHEQLTRDNPCAFSDELSRRMPTSVDLLEPESPLLQATSRLPFRRDVKLHSIIGTGSWSPCSGPGDGVVPVSSARLCPVASERFVESKHVDETRNEEVIGEVFRILAEHAAMDRPAGPARCRAADPGE